MQVTRLNRILHMNTNFVSISGVEWIAGPSLARAHKSVQFVPETSSRTGLTPRIRCHFHFLYWELIWKLSSVLVVIFLSTFREIKKWLWSYEKVTKLKLWGNSMKLGIISYRFFHEGILPKDFVLENYEFPLPQRAYKQRLFLPGPHKWDLSHLK